GSMWQQSFVNNMSSPDAYDLSKISSDNILDVSNAQKAAEHLQTPFTRNVAAAHQEVLVFGEIPSEAIIGFL
ncbi:hypothetical protein, partial [Erwinia endophytica]|uniref:hypothetical protein n=1 Tax=Erwinia endophytica TaxID=1563158 RepID=UPI00186B92E6